MQDTHLVFKPPLVKVNFFTCFLYWWVCSDACSQI